MKKNKSMNDKVSTPKEQPLQPNAIVMADCIKAEFETPGKKTGLRVMTDPPSDEFYETGTVPGLEHGDRSPKADKHKPNTDCLAFFGQPRQLEFEFLADLPLRLTKIRHGNKGWFVTNLICPGCLQFIFFLEGHSRRMYQCRCGSVLASPGNRLNRQPPTLTEWEAYVRGWQEPGRGPIFNRDNQ
jgi:hypothetical protein